MDKTDVNGQSPIFYTVNSRAYGMLKFLMTNDADFTLKDNRGDTIRDYIYRYSLKEQNLIDLYDKYEARMLVKKTLSGDQPLKVKMQALTTVFKWSWIFAWEIVRYLRTLLAVNYSLHMLAFFYALLYALHWFLVGDQASKAILFHFVLILLCINAFFFFKADCSSIEKKHLARDRDTSLVGQLLYLMERRQLHKIEELAKRFCFECLVIKAKHADHCKHCDCCVNYRHKHSQFFGRCVGLGNARSYVTL